jgi:hypothetical protein
LLFMRRVFFSHVTPLLEIIAKLPGESRLFFDFS